MPKKFITRLNEAMSEAGLQPNRLPSSTQDPTLGITYDSLNGMEFVKMGEVNTDSENIVGPGYDPVREIHYDVDTGQEAVETTVSAHYTVPDFYYAKESAEKYGDVQTFFTQLAKEAPEFVREIEPMATEINNVTAGAIDDDRADYIKVVNIEPLSTPDHYKLDLTLRADTDFSREAAGPG